MSRKSISGQQWSKGAIKRIKLEQFLTYDRVEFFPGPSLNTIVAPNGSGKSTVVCAICLGLGGKTSIMGRAAQLQDYIKHGYDKATIEIELHNTDGDNYLIFRELSLHSTTSKWKLNGKHASQKQVETLISDLNIQVSNLCQFLPQDRVADFVKMTPQELLENTEKAVGLPGMYEDHHRLKELQNNKESYDTFLTSQKKQYETEVQKNVALEEEVKIFEESQKIELKITTLKQKRLWALYEEARVSYVKAADAAKEYQEQLVKNKKAYAPLEQKLQQFEEELRVCNQNRKELSKKFVNIASTVISKENQFESLEEKCKEIKSNLDNRIKEEEDRKQRLHECKKTFEMLQRDLAALETEDKEIEPQLHEVQHRIDNATKQLMSVQYDKENMKEKIHSLKKELEEVQFKIKKGQDLSNIRFENLRRRNKHAYEAAMWLRENQHRFKKKIFEPIMTQINVKQPQYAKYVESHIPFKDMVAFVAESSEDADEFLSIVRDNMNLRISCVIVPNVQMSSFKPGCSIDKVRQWGFFSHIKDMFTAPEPVMKYLCCQYRIYDIPVGDKQTEKYIEQVIDNLHFSRFYTDAQVYSIKKSRYTNKKTSMSWEIKSPSLLTTLFDSAVLRELEDKQAELLKCISDYQEQIADCTRKDQEINYVLEQHRRKKKELSTSRSKRKLMEAMIEQKRNLIQKLEQDKIAVDVEQAKANSEINKLHVKRLNIIREIKNLVKDSKSIQTEDLCKNLEAVTLREKRKFVFSALKESREATENLEKLYQERLKNSKSLRIDAQKLLEQAKAACNTSSTSELAQSLKAEFLKYPDSLKEIDAVISQEQAKMDCMLQTDPVIIDEYKQRSKHIEAMRAEILSKENKLTDIAAEIETIRERWLEPLEELLEKINLSFSNFFAELGCAGDISLYKGEHANQFDKYGVTIRVKFRDSQCLTELTPFHQSGGERSVATILYMMSLQELTSVPFRCVDEINQGMDSENERKVFELIVKTAHKNSAQYFLLSPKLLPDLPYSENMDIIFINKGRHMHMEYAQWSLRNFLNIARKVYR